MSRCHSENRFGPVQFVLDVGNFHLSLLSEEVADKEGEELWVQYSEELYDLLVDGATAMAREGIDPSFFLEHYPAYSNIFWKAQEDQSMEDWCNGRINPGAMGKVTVYCPRGCNQLTVSAEFPFDECAACGQMMVAEAEDGYYDSLIMAGQAQ